MQTNRMILFIVLVMQPVLTAYGQQTDEYSLFQVTLGLGQALSFEKDVFNVPSDVKGSPDLGANIGFYRHLSPTFAAGLQIYVTVQEIPGFAVTDNSGMTRIVTFDLSNVSVAAHGRWIFSRESIKPYAFGLICLTSSTVESKETGELSAGGFGAGVGGGIEVPFSSSFSFSIEAILVLGTAKWKQRPFLNSSSDAYNPSIAGLSLNLSYHWGGW